MNLALVPANASSPLGDPSNRRLLRFASGPYAHRLVALLHTEPNVISLIWSDHPYAEKSSPVTVTSNCDDSPFDCCIDQSGNINIVHIEQTSGNLVFRRLTFASGAWYVGNEIIVCNAGQCHSPSLALDPTGQLWVAFARFSAPNRMYYCKSSTDFGSTWGTGPSDPGDIVSDSALLLNARLLCSTNDLFLFLAYGNARVACRSRSLNGSSWSSETQLAASANISTTFDAGISPAGAIGLAYLDSSILRYREFDGVTWSPAITLSSSAYSPQMIFRNETPVVIFLSPFEGAQTRPSYVYRSGDAFTSPAPLDLRATTFDSVVLFDQMSASFADLTFAASDATTADVYHPSSFALVKNVGDAVYLGMDVPFRYIQFNLFTPGAGGTIAFNFWDGSTWVPFTPESGMAHLTAATTRIALWNDYRSIPPSWQKSSIGALNHFWIRLDVTSAYTTTPVASRIAAIAESAAISCARI